MANQETKKVLTVVDRSTKALLAAASGLTDVVTQAQSSATLLANLATDIEFAQNKLESVELEYGAKVRDLEAEVANKARSLEADLALQVKENKQKVLSTLQGEFGLAHISKAELADIQKDLDYAQREITKEINEAVEGALKENRLTYESKVRDLEAQHKVEIAQYQANAVSQENQIKLLNETINNLREQQDKDREAQIKIAESRAGEKTNINVAR